MHNKLIPLIDEKSHAIEKQCVGIFNKLSICAATYNSFEYEISARQASEAEEYHFQTFCEDTKMVKNVPSSLRRISTTTIVAPVAPHLLSSLHTFAGSSEL